MVLAPCQTGLRIVVAMLQRASLTKVMRGQKTGINHDIPEFNIHF